MFASLPTASLIEEKFKNNGENPNLIKSGLRKSAITPSACKARQIPYAFG